MTFAVDDRVDRAGRTPHAARGQSGCDVGQFEGVEFEGPSVNDPMFCRFTKSARLSLDCGS